MGFVEGYNASRSHWQNRRSEAARAFSEFRRMNPSASYEDYSSFVDQITGGNSFVRGSIPSGDVLRSIAAEGQRQAQSAQVQRNLEMMRAQAQLAGTLTTMASQYALQYNNDAEIEDILIGSLGGNDLARDQVRRMFPSGFGGVRERARAKLVRDLLPDAIEMMKANPDVDLTTFFPELSNSRDTLTSIQRAAKEKIDQQNRKRIDEEQATVLGRAKSVIEATGQPYRIPDWVSDDVRQQLQPQVDSMYQKYMNIEKTANDKKRKDAFDAAKKNVTSDPGVMFRLNKQGSDYVSILQQALAAEGLPDPTLEEIQALRADMLDDHVAQQSQANKAERQAAIDKAKETAVARQTSATEALLGVFNDENPNVYIKKAGSYAGIAAQTIRMIAERYDLTSERAQASLFRLMDDEYLSENNVDPQDPGALYDFITSNENFTQFAPPIDQGGLIRDTQASAATGLPDEMMSSTAFIEDYDAKTRDFMDRLQSGTVSKLMAADDISANAEIYRTIQQLEAMIQATKRDVERYKLTADKWLIPDSGPLNYDALLEAQQRRVNEMTSVADALIQKARQLETVTKAAPTSVEPSTWPSPGNARGSLDEQRGALDSLRATQDALRRQATSGR